MQNGLGIWTSCCLFRYMVTGESLDVVRYLISIKEPSLTTSWKSLLVMRGMIRISTCNLWNDGRPLHSLKIVEVLHVKNLARVRIFCHYFFDLETSSF